MTDVVWCGECDMLCSVWHCVIWYMVKLDVLQCDLVCWCYPCDMVWFGVAVSWFWSDLGRCAL
jgi:hypothetical protein